MLRRVVAKALWAGIKEDIKERLEPLQVGVGTSMGAESIVHSVREWLERNGEDEGKVLGMLDLTNAFNELERSAFRKAVREMMPSLAPWVDSCYGSTTALMMGTKRLHSRRGMQQGDPLGPALFGMGIQ
mgnify:FL=1